MKGWYFKTTKQEFEARLGRVMNKSQLNAIAYAYKRKQEAENDKKLKDLGLYEVFNKQTIYTNKIFFLRAVEKRTPKGQKAIMEGVRIYIRKLFETHLTEKIENEVTRLYFICEKYCGDELQRK